jgi:hypothetical protein
MQIYSIKHAIYLVIKKKKCQVKYILLYYHYINNFTDFKYLLISCQL